MGRYVALIVYFNAHDQKVAQIIEDEEMDRPRYFDSVDEIRLATNRQAPFNVLCVNLDSEEVEEIL